MSWVLVVGVLAAVTVYAVAVGRLVDWWEDRRATDKLVQLRLTHEVTGSVAGAVVSWSDDRTGAQVTVVVPWTVRGQERALLLAKESPRLVQGAVEASLLVGSQQRHPSRRGVSGGA